jgi:putative transcriptional regulator
MAKKITAGQRIIASAKEAIAFGSGKNNGCIIHLPKRINVTNIRKKVKMTQSQFAAYFGVNIRTLQEWEQGRSEPSTPSKAFLIVIDREPEAVRRALTGDLKQAA